MLGMMSKRDADRWGSGLLSSSSSSSSSSLLPLSLLLLHVWSDLLRLLSSFLLGQNGFRHPLSVLLFDLLVVGFFQSAAVIGLYRMRLDAAVLALLHLRSDGQRRVRHAGRRLGHAPSRGQR